MEERKRSKVKFHNLYVEEQVYPFLKEKVDDIEAVVVWNTLDQDNVSIWLHGFYHELNKHKIENEIDCLVASFLKYTNFEEAFSRLSTFFHRKPSLYLYSLHIEGVFKGVIAFQRKDNVAWKDDEKALLYAYGFGLAMKLYSDKQKEDYAINKYVFDEVLETMKASIYVSDINNDEILFMNNELKDSLQINQYQGKKCYEVLHNSEEKCDFCPKTMMDVNKSQKKAYVWEEVDPKTHRIYEKWDRLLKWRDGRIVHFHHAIDVTKSRKLQKEATTDELTGVLSRRAGKEKLRKTLVKAKNNNEQFCAVMFDVNELKVINDTYGHLEGDRLLRCVTQVITHNMNEKDFLFRLSGDEFFGIFYEISAQQCKERLHKVLKELKYQSLFPKEERDEEFCYGILEVHPNDHYNVKDIFTQTDRLLYEQKRDSRMKLLKRREKKTRKNQAINMLRQKDSLLNSIMNCSQGYLFFIDCHTYEMHIPKVMCDAFVFPEMILNQAQMQIYSDEDVVAKIKEKIQKEEKHVPLEWLFKHKEKGYTVYESNCEIQYNKHQKANFLIAFITDKKE